MMHNFFEEDKKNLGISGNVSEMAREISKMVSWKAKELARQYIHDTVLFKDDEREDVRDNDLCVRCYYTLEEAKYFLEHKWDPVEVVWKNGQDEVDEWKD